MTPSASRPPATATSTLPNKLPNPLPGTATGQPAPAPVAHEAATEPRWPGFLRLASLLMAGLTLALWGLALWQSNPVVLSPLQFERADELVVAHRESNESQHVVVDQVLKGGLEPGARIRVPNLPPPLPEEPRTGLLLPLSPFRRDFRVTVLNEANPVPLVYPASAEVLAQTRRLLAPTPR